MFKSREQSALPALDAALAKETDPRIKQALTEARAAVILYSDDASEADKLAAVSVIRARGDQEALNLLAGLPAGSPAAVQRAARDAVTAMQNQLAVWATVQNAWYGLSLGSVLLLAAIGLAITFGVMGVINMAHGEMVMIGAYVTFMVQEYIRTSSPGLFDYSLLIAVPLAFVVAGFIGILIEQGIIRFLYGRPLETLLATWGLSLILQQAVRTAFGPTNREVGAPSWMSGTFSVGQINITYGRLWIIVFTMAVFVGLLGLLRFTRLGLEMRAVTQNRAMAASMGIRTARVDALTFGLGSGIAGIAGVALSQIDNVSPNLGQGYIIDSFLVVVFGGVGNLWGTLVGALHARHRQQVPGAVRRRGARQDRDPGAHHPVHPEAPARAVRAQGPGGGSMMPPPLIRILDRGALIFLAVLAAVTVLVPLLNLCCRRRRRPSTCRPIWWRCSANTSATRSWRSRST